METIIFTLQTGMAVFLQPIMLVYALGGLLFGMYAGAMPGISATMAISLMVSFTITGICIPPWQWPSGAMWARSTAAHEAQFC